MEKKFGIGSYSIEALSRPDSPEIRTIALEHGSEDESQHATGHSSRYVEFWLWHDRGVLQEEMDSFEEH